MKVSIQNSWYKLSQMSDNIYLTSGKDSLFKSLPAWMMGILLTLFSGSTINSAIERYNLNEKQKSEMFSLLQDKDRINQIRQELNSANVDELGSLESLEDLSKRKTLSTPQLQTPSTPKVNSDVDSYNTSLIADHIARTLWGEAEGESLEGQIAVASVIWNRAKGNPNNIIGVIKAPKQFSIWNNGTPRQGSGPIWEKIKKISEQMAKGNFTPSYNFNHYYNPQKANPKWAYEKNDRKGKRRPYTTIGNHRFLKL